MLRTSRKLKGKEPLIIADLKKGLSVSVIAEQHGVTGSAIYAMIKRCGYHISTERYIMPPADFHMVIPHHEYDPTK